MLFQDLRLSEPVLRAITTEGYQTPTPIQAKAIPHVLEGKDLMGCAQTGTGKTAAFALPILHRLHTQKPTHTGNRRAIRCLVLSPTRELAVQIADSFRTYGRHVGLHHAVIFGGVNQNPQTRQLKQGVDVVVATPGRLLDLMEQGHVDLRSLEMFVLDEADRMLDMGFINDIRKIISKLPAHRQTLMFSATMPREIKSLADGLLRNPVYVEVAPVSSTVEKIEQSVYHVPKRHKPVLLKHLLNKLSITRCLVFTRTKHGADRVVRQLDQAGIPSAAIHGNKSQNNRQRALENFRKGKTHILIATDIAARGIDIDEISHVINYDLPNEPESYVHRIGRTARAGASGAAIAFCDADERGFLRDIERLTKQQIAVRSDHPEYPAHVESHDSHHGHSHGGHPRHHSDSGHGQGGNGQRRRFNPRGQNRTRFSQNRGGRP